MDYTALEFSRPEHWSGEPFPSLEDLPNSGIKPRSPALQADSSPAEPQEKPKNTEVGNISLLPQIFPTQESNWGLLHCRQILYQLSYQGSPGILELVDFPFSRRSSQPRNWTGVSCIAGRFFTNWATREAQPFNITEIQVYAPTTNVKKLKLSGSMKTYKTF